MSRLTELTLAAARDGLRRKEFSAAELAEAHIQAMEAGRSLNAFITETPQRALGLGHSGEQVLEVAQDRQGV